jgi:hypothetical protein
MPRPAADMPLMRACRGAYPGHAATMAAFFFRAGALPCLARSSPGHAALCPAAQCGRITSIMPCSMVVCCHRPGSTFHGATNAYYGFRSHDPDGKHQER